MLLRLALYHRSHTLSQDIDSKKDPFCRDSIVTFAISFISSRDPLYGLRSTIMDPNKSLHDVHEIITESFIALLYTAVSLSFSILLISDTSFLVPMGYRFYSCRSEGQWQEGQIRGLLNAHLFVCLYHSPQFSHQNGDIFKAGAPTA